MFAKPKVIEMHVCFKSKLMNADILVDTTDVKEARRIARIWGNLGGECVTRTIYGGLVKPYDAETIMVDNVKVWLPSF